MIKSIGRAILSALLLAAMVGFPACSGAQAPEDAIERHRSSHSTSGDGI